MYVRVPWRLAWADSLSRKSLRFRISRRQKKELILPLPILLDNQKISFSETKKHILIGRPHCLTLSYPQGVLGVLHLIALWSLTGD